MQKQSNMNAYLTASIVGALTFIILYGPLVLNPCYTDWLMHKGDLSQHYLGWKAYRLGQWTFPVGLTNRLSYPYYTSMMFTDSIPLFALIFKIFSSILPKTFQYFGLWGILCFVLNSILAAKIIEKYSKSLSLMVLGGILINLSPSMINRMFRHTALASIWLILLAFLTIIYYEEIFNNTRKATLFWGVLGLLVGLIHLYYFLFCGIILGGYCILDFIKTHKIKRGCLSALAFSGAILTSVFFIGGFYGNHLQANNVGLGFFSYNLLGIINPMGWSCILKDMPLYVKDQYEGFSYLGAGIIVLCLSTLTILLFRLHKWRLWIGQHKAKLYACLFITICSVIAAASPVITFGPYKLLELPVPEIIRDMWSVFRSSGRAIWIVVYMIMLWAICADTKVIKTNCKVMILCGCILLQIYDIQGILIEKHNYFSSKIRYETLLKDPAWEKISNSNIEHILLASSLDQNILYSLADYALDHNITLNDFYFSRSTSDSVERSREASKHADRNELYIFMPDDFSPEKYSWLNYYEADGLFICYQKESESLLRK